MGIFTTWSAFLRLHKLRNKLFLCSLLLTLSLALLFFYLFQQFLADRFIRIQTDYKLNSFKQAENYLDGSFEETVESTAKLIADPSILAPLTDAYAPRDYPFILTTTQQLEALMSRYFTNNANIEHIFVLGSNDFSYMYTPFHDGSYLAEDFDFDSFRSRLSDSRTTEPSYFQADKLATSDRDDSALRLLIGRMDAHIVYSKEIKRGEATVGLAIVTFRSDLVADFLREPDDRERILLTTKSLQPIWSSEGSRAGDGAPLADIPDAELSYQESNGRMILRYDLAELSMLSVMPRAGLLTTNGYGKYFLLFCLLSVAALMLFSYWFAGKISRPLFELSRRFVKGIHGQDRPLRIWIPSLSLRQKIIWFFLLTTFVPNLLFIGCISYLSYEHYQDQIIAYSKKTMDTGKQNVDRQLALIEQYSRQIGYHPGVQALMKQAKEAKEDGQEAAAGAGSGAKPELDAIISQEFIRKGIIGAAFYSIAGEELGATLYFDGALFRDRIGELLAELAATDGESLFFKSMEDSRSDSVLTFSRKVKGLGGDAQFAKPIGYLFVQADAASLNRVMKDMRIGRSGSFYLLDPSEQLVSESDQTLSGGSRLRTALLDALRSNPDAGGLSLDNQLIFQTESKVMPFHMIGVIGTDVLKQDILKFVIYDVLFFAGYFLLILTVSAVLSRRLTRPLRSLVELADEAASGNTTVSLPYAGRDEISILSKHFNGMVTQINQLIEERYQAGLREKELQYLEQEAQLKALQQQINPHFLYNALDSIKWMAYRHGAEEICEMTTALGKFFRGTIARDNDLIHVSYELEHLKNYLYIQSIRYGDKFATEWDIDPNVNHLPIPRMTLQPIVENALIHGLEELDEGGRLSISARLIESRIQFTIRDNGIGMQSEQLRELMANIANAHATSSIGLVNVYRRFHLMFLDQFHFQIESRPEAGTTVTLSYPVSFILK